MVASFGATAFFAPYEVDFLNALDVTGLFALIVTQIFSIVYFYAETAERPFMDKGALEVLVTLILFLINIAVILVFFAAFVSEVLGLRAKLRQRGTRVVRIVAEHGAGRGADIVGAEEGYWWHHPSGVAVRTPPVQQHDADGIASGVWAWHDTDGGIVASTGPPELLQDVDGLAALEVEEEYRLMHSTTHRVSAAAKRYRDVGGILCCWDRAGGAADTAADAGAAAVAAALVGTAAEQQAPAAKAPPERLEGGITDSVKRSNRAVVRQRARHHSDVAARERPEAEEPTPYTVARHHSDVAARERPEAEEPTPYTVAAQVLQSPDGGGAPPKARRLSTHRREKRMQARAAKRDKRAALAAQQRNEVGIAMGDINPLRDAKNRVVHGL